MRQAIIASYTGAPPEEYTPYLLSALRPLRPMVLSGVQARAWEGENKPADHAVMQWWKEPLGAHGVSIACACVCSISECRPSMRAPSQTQGHSKCPGRASASPICIVSFRYGSVPPSCVWRRGLARVASPVHSPFTFPPCQYHALPFMANAMHTEDTLFFVAEGDFRIYEEDCQRELSQFEYEATQRRALTVRRQCSSFKWYAPMDTDLPDGAESVTAPSEATGSASAAPAPPASSSTAPPRSGAEVPLWEQWDVPLAREVRDILDEPDTQIFESPHLPSAEENTEPTPELLDLICLCTKAHRLGRGNFVWLGWNASPSGGVPRRAQSIGNGSQLIAVTTKGARWLLNRLEVLPACLQAPCIALARLEQHSSQRTLSTLFFPPRHRAESVTALAYASCLMHASPSRTITSIW